MQQDLHPADTFNRPGTLLPSPSTVPPTKHGFATVLAGTACGIIVGGNFGRERRGGWDIRLLTQTREREKVGLAKEYAMGLQKGCRPGWAGGPSDITKGERRHTH